MRPSIAAALSTLGPIHSADAVLLRPADVSRFDDLKGEYEATDRRIIERPDGSLILMWEFDPTGSGGYDKEEVQFALVGAVPEGAWMWADPKLRAAKVSLDARDIHCLTQGGEIHRGATVGTTPTGLVALQGASKHVYMTCTPFRVPSVFTEEMIAAFNEGAERLRSSKPADRLDMRPTPKPAIRVKSSAAPSSPRPVTAIVDDPEPIVVASLDGRTLGSLTPAEEAAIPDGAEALPPSRLTPTFTRSKGQWISPEGYAQQTWDSERVIRLPKPARTPKNGDRLDSFTAAELDALPVGSRFSCHQAVATKNGPKSWKDVFDRQGIDYDYTSAEVLGLCGGSRTLVLPKPVEAPKPAPSPKVGDRWGDLTPEQRRAMPVGTVLAPDDRTSRHVTLFDDGLWHGCGLPLKTLAPDRTIAFIPPTTESK